MFSKFLALLVPLAVAFAGCSSSSNPSTSGSPGSGTGVAASAGASTGQGPAGQSTSGTTGTAPTTGNGPGNTGSGTDSGSGTGSGTSGGTSTGGVGSSTGIPYPPSCPDSAVPVHLPSGFTDLGPIAGGGGYVQMALDENDDPMFVYETSLELDGGMAQFGVSYYFTRWDPCAGALTTPLFIDSAASSGLSSGTLNYVLAYDPSTKEVGVAYEKPYDCSFDTEANQCSNGYFVSVWYASLKAGTSAFVTQFVSLNQCYPGFGGQGPLDLSDPSWTCVGSSPGATGDITDSTSPALAMGGGNVYLMYVTPPYSIEPDLVSGNAVAVLLSSTASLPPYGDAADGGFVVFDGGEVGNLGAGALPHYFSARILDTGNDTAFNNVDYSTGLALDSSGALGAAFFTTNQQSGDEWLSYWHAGTTTVAADGVVSNPQLSLAFEGTAPRVAGLFTVDSLDAGFGYAISYVSSSNAGTAWNAVEPVNASGSTPAGDTYEQLVVGPSGDEYLTASASEGYYTGGCNAGLNVLSSTNSGASFGGCGVASPLPANDLGSLGVMTAAIGTTRLAGVYTVAGTAETACNADAGSDCLFGPYDFLYYQTP